MTTPPESCCPAWRAAGWDRFAPAPPPAWLPVIWPERDADSVGVIGSGFQARSQLEAICAVRDIKQAKVLQPPPGAPGRVCPAHGGAAEPGNQGGGHRSGMRVRCGGGGYNHLGPGPGAGRGVAGARNPRQRRRRESLDTTGRWTRRRCCGPRLSRWMTCDQAENRVRRPDVAGKPGRVPLGSWSASCRT